MDKKTTETVKLFDDAAQGYQDKYMDVSPYAMSLSLFCESLSSPESSILDVACGPGNVAKFVTDKMPGIRILASDLSENMLRLTKANVPNAETQLLDAKYIGTLNLKFDGVLASFIFPYLSKVEVISFINDAKELLNGSGVLYMSTMQGENSDSGYVGPKDGKQMFMNYHEIDYLETAFEGCGFDLLSSKLQPYDYGAENSGTDIIIIGKLKS